MDEHHNNEQFFFDGPTLTTLTAFAADFPNICCLCAPLLGKMLIQKGLSVTTLDIDERFAAVSGFQRYDITNPHWLPETFGLIVCDPPFFNVPLARLVNTIRLLSHYNDRQPLLLCYLTRRANSVVRSFARFNLEPTGYYPRYQTVSETKKNEIEFFGNLGAEAHARLSRLQQLD